MTRRGFFAEQRLRRKAQRLELAGAHVLDQHAGVGDEPPQIRLALVGLEVERDGLLVAVGELPEIGVGLARTGPAHAAGRIATRRLDLDDLGAEIGEVSPGSRAGHHRGELDDADARERTSSRVHHASPTGRSGNSTARVNVHTFAWSWLKPSVRTVSTPCPGRDCERRADSTSVIAVERVAVEQRRRVAQLAEAEIGDGPPGNVGHAHPQQQGIDEAANHDVPAVLHLDRREVPIDMQRARRARQQAEHMIFRLGDGVSRPMPEHVAGLVFVQIPAEMLLPGIVDARHLTPRAPGSARRSALPRRP